MNVQQKSKTTLYIYHHIIRFDQHYLYTVSDDGVLFGLHYIQRIYYGIQKAENVNLQIQ